MKKIILRFKTPFVLLIALVALVWVSFPYLFSNETWKVQDEAVAQTFETKEKFIIGENIIFVAVMHDKSKRQFEFSYEKDVVDGSEVKAGEQVYIYKLGRTPCLSHQAVIQDYGARWRYYSRCELFTFRSYVVWILAAIFIGFLIDAFKRKD